MPNCFGEYGSRTECTAEGKLGCSVKKSCKKKHNAVIISFKVKWMPIQRLREEKAEQQKIRKKAEKEVRRLSQLIPQKLNEFNNEM
ncbi:hypothetical protein LCGC14_2322190 [marine sediment metagenome]|uniref:Uncharacterized protein n=1 Tax=marine sediment metagenome TaxID=412755 RepID=A0A0F9EUZ8_9ZZZZ